MNWTDAFARRTQAMRRNTVREFLKLAKQPGMISFAGGLPAAELFPFAEISRVTAAILERSEGSALQYGETEGVRELRTWIAEKHRVPTENVIITSGAQQALDLIGKVLLDPADRVAVENPTYLALLTAWRPLEPHFVPIDSDSDGLIPESIPEGIKALYLVPNYQNPTGATLSRERRQTLGQIAQKRNLIIVEDDPYQELRYEGDPLPSIFSLANAHQGPVIRVGTLSKVLAPGLRIGWIIAATPLIEKLVLAKQTMDLHTSTLNQRIAFDLASSGFIDTHLPKIRALYRARRDSMLRALEKVMPRTCSWTQPKGGMFLLVTLPFGADAALLARAALDHGVMVVPGEDFHVSGGENTFRLNFSSSSETEISNGIERLGQMVRSLVTSPQIVPTRSIPSDRTELNV